MFRLPSTTLTSAPIVFLTAIFELNLLSFIHHYIEIEQHYLIKAYVL